MTGRWTIAILLLCAAAAMAQTPLPTPSKPSASALEAKPIAKAARHPGPLQIHEEGVGEISPSYGMPVWAASVESADDSFAHMLVVLLDGNTFLTPAVSERFDKAIAAPPAYAAQVRGEIDGRRQRADHEQDRQQAEKELAELDRLRAMGPLVRPVPLSNGKRGYATVLGFSRHDTTFATVLPSPDGRYDVLVTVAVPFEPGKLDPATGRYRTRMREQPLQTVQEMALVIYRQLYPPPRKVAAGH